MTVASIPMLSAKPDPSPWPIRHAAEEIAPAHHDGNLHAEVMDVGNFAGDGMNMGGVNAKALIGGQRFAGELEQMRLKTGVGMTKRDPSIRSGRQAVNKEE